MLPDVVDTSRLPARYRRLRTLGRGGMGLVHAAYDRERGLTVALKQLRRVEPDRVYRFKREFRALSDLSHPNIVQLYDLLSVGEDWFLSMEIIEGAQLMNHLRGLQLPERGDVGEPGAGASDDRTRFSYPGGPSGELLDPTRTSLWPIESPIRLAKVTSPSGDIAPSGERPALATPRSIGDVVVLERLRPAFRQLAEALHAMHSVGLVHRDLKPSNVLVDGAGRVVLVDFGMVAELREHADVVGGRVMGTPLYMAPEQAAGSAMGAPADWYAFGVMLYEALCGQAPQQGTPLELIESKAHFQVIPPSQRVHGVPGELETLCLALLAKVPAERPPGQAVLQTLGADGGPASASPIPGTVDSVFVGRADELTLLQGAYVASCATGARSVLVRGRSGIGKTRLLDHFIERLQHAGASESGEGAPLILASRCHEAENLPYQALDEVIDSSSLHLLDMPEQQRATLLPTHISALARVFPVLDRLPGVAGNEAAHEPALLRTQALEALRQLLRGLAGWRPLVIRIEDSHWSDPDSREVLESVLSPPTPARLLIVATVRSEPEHRHQATAIAEVLARHTPCDVIELGPLSPVEERTLVRRLVARDALTEATERAILEGCAGHPMLLTELVRHAARADASAAQALDTRATAEALAVAASTSIETLIWQRACDLAPGSRALLQAVCVAGEPTLARILGQVAGLDPVARERAMADIRSHHLLRITKGGGEPWVDVYHDIVRQAILDQTDGEHTRELHRTMATILANLTAAPPARIAAHWLAAGERAAAVTQLQVAARSACQQLAFEGGLALYRQALEVLESDASDDPVVQMRAVRIRVELASMLRDIERHDDALDELELVEGETSDLAMYHEQATAHYLRGSLLFSRGRIEASTAAHERARALAQLAGSVECEARALSGLGDAYYLRGQMNEGREFFDECLRRCQQHGLRAFVPANLAMRGLTGLYVGDLSSARADCIRARDQALRAGDRRAALLARGYGLSQVLLEQGDLTEAMMEADAAVHLADELGVVRHQAMTRSVAGIIYQYAGRSRAAESLLATSVQLERGGEFAFSLPMALIGLAWTTEDPGLRQRARAEAKEVLERAPMSHSFLHFHRIRMEIGLQHAQPALVESSAAALRRYVGGPVTGWRKIWLERAQALLAVARFGVDAERLALVREVRDRVREAGFITASLALSQVLGDPVDLPGEARDTVEP